jgi:hypothetical protein
VKTPDRDLLYRREGLNAASTAEVDHSSRLVAHLRCSPSRKIRPGAGRPGHGLQLTVPAELPGPASSTHSSTVRPASATPVQTTADQHCRCRRRAFEVLSPATDKLRYFQHIADQTVKAVGLTHTERKRKHLVGVFASALPLRSSPRTAYHECLRKLCRPPASMWLPPGQHPDLSLAEPRCDLNEWCCILQPLPPAPASPQSNYTVVNVA